MAKKRFDGEAFIELEGSLKRFARWTKYGNDRIYITRDDGKKSYGYIDLKHKKKLVCHCDLIYSLTPYVEYFLAHYSIPREG